MDLPMTGSPEIMLESAETFVYPPAILLSTSIDRLAQLATSSSIKDELQRVLPDRLEEIAVLCILSNRGELAHTIAAASEQGFLPDETEGSLQGGIVNEEYLSLEEMTDLLTTKNGKRLLSAVARSFADSCRPENSNDLILSAFLAYQKLSDISRSEENSLTERGSNPKDYAKVIELCWSAAPEVAPLESEVLELTRQNPNTPIEQIVAQVLAPRQSVWQQLCSQAQEKSSGDPQDLTSFERRVLGGRTCALFMQASQQSFQQ